MPAAWTGGPDGAFNVSAPNGLPQAFPGARGSRPDGHPGEGGAWGADPPGPAGIDRRPHRRALVNVLTGISEPPASAPSLSGTHILVVDDSWVARRAIAQLLIPHGCVIHDARDTAAASQILAERRVDLILLDLLLPGESGLAFCARLGAEGAIEYTPVVVVSGISTSENVVQAIRAGASYFLVKPVSEHYLLRILFGVLRQYRSEQVRASAG